MRAGIDMQNLGAWNARKRRLAAARGMLAMAALLGSVLGARAQTPAAKKPSGLNELLPSYTRTTLPNGLTLLMLEQHELPLVNFEFLIKTGSIGDPAGKEGLADLTLSLLRKGTSSRKAEQIADELDFLGGTLEFDTSIERSSISAQFLAKDVDQGLGLVADVLLHPTFPDDERKKLIDLNVNGIRESKDNPRTVIGNYFAAFLFQQHPFGRPVGGTEATQPRLGQADVQKYYSDFIRPNTTILAVAGDFDANAMRAKIEKAFGAWEQKASNTPAAAVPKPFKGRRVLLVDKPDAAQTYFQVGNVGIAKGNPDEATLDVVNTVFGGRFTSWLSTELRIKSGLSYNANSRFVARRVPGPFYISSFTRTDATEKAMDLALQVLDRLHKQGLSSEELDSARSYIRGQFPPRYETPGQLAAAMAELEFFGLDRSYINEHTRKTDAVTLADTKRAIAAHYPNKDLAIAMVGQAAKVKKGAAKYGPVVEKKITDPGF